MCLYIYIYTCILFFQGVRLHPFLKSSLGKDLIRGLCTAGVAHIIHKSAGFHDVTAVLYSEINIYQQCCDFRSLWPHPDHHFVFESRVARCWWRIHPTLRGGETRLAIGPRALSKSIFLKHILKISSRYSRYVLRVKINFYLWWTDTHTQTCMYII